jgi:hypothetical protein
MEENRKKLLKELLLIQEDCLRRGEELEQLLAEMGHPVSEKEKMTLDRLGENRMKAKVE